MKPKLKKWTHPYTGETRHYLTNWQPESGLKLTENPPGTIQTATLNGDPIPIEVAERIQRIKIWMNENGEITADGLPHEPWDPEILTVLNNLKDTIEEAGNQK